MSCDSLRVSQVLSYCPSTEKFQARAPNHMTNARKHHLDKEFIVAKLIEDDRSKSKFGSWSFHNERHCVDILTGAVLAHPTSQFGQRATRTPHHCEPPKLQRVITSPSWIRFKRRLNTWNCMKLEIISRTAKSQNSLVLTEQRCRGGTRVHSTPAPRRRASDSYSTHNRSMNLCCT
jgi:hypothetical protein